MRARSLAALLGASRLLPTSPAAPLAPASWLLLEAGGLRHRRPALHLAVEVAGEVLGAAADEIDALRRQRLGDLVRLERLVAGARELVDDLLRSACGRHETEPQAGLEAGQSGLGHGREGWRHRRAPRFG